MFVTPYKEAGLEFAAMTWLPLGWLWHPKVFTIEAAGGHCGGQQGGTLS